MNDPKDRSPEEDAAYLASRDAADDRIARAIRKTTSYRLWWEKSTPSSDGKNQPCWQAPPDPAWRQGQRAMSIWVLTKGSGWYVSRPGSERSYTRDKARAWRFSSRDAALRQACGNERAEEL